MKKFSLTLLFVSILVIPMFVFATVGYELFTINGCKYYLDTITEDYDGDDFSYHMYDESNSFHPTIKFLKDFDSFEYNGTNLFVVLGNKVTINNLVLGENSKISFEGEGTLYVVAENKAAYNALMSSFVVDDYYVSYNPTTKIITISDKNPIFENNENTGSGSTEEEEQEEVVVNHTISNENASFTSEDELDTNYVLVTEDITSDLTEENIADIENEVKDSKFTNLYEISIFDSNNVIVPMENGKFTIKLKLTDEMKKFNSFKVVYLDDQYELVDILSANVDGDYLVFETTHLSKYGVLGYNVENPNTGDNILLSILLLSLSVIGLGVCTFRKFSKNN